MCFSVSDSMDFLDFRLDLTCDEFIDEIFDCQTTNDCQRFKLHLPFVSYDCNCQLLGNQHSKKTLKEKRLKQTAAGQENDN